MKLINYFKNIFLGLWHLMQGMYITLLNMCRPKVTEQYPENRGTYEYGERFRALLPDFVPLGMPYRMVHLEDGAPMDGYSYLADNGVLTEERVSQMDDTEADDVILE